MTVETDVSRVSYIGAGTTGPFAIPFYFLANADIRAIKVTIADGTEDELALTTDFTLTGAGDENGGALTLVSSLSAAFQLIIFRDPALLQEAEYSPNDSFPSETHEEVVDRLTMIAQRNRELIDRSLRQPDGDSANITTLPAKVTRASAYLAFDADGDPIAAAPSSGVITSVFMATVLDDTSAPQARATLGLPAIAAKGDLITGSAADTLTKLPVGADGEILLPAAGATSGLAWLRNPFGGAAIINGKITRSVGASALTVALKTLADADPSAASPVYVMVPSVTSNVFDGDYVIRKVTAALSLVISSGSTLGHASAVASPVYIYLLDNAGTLELAASNKFFGSQSVQSSTAEGGLGAADSGTTLYSTTARSNVAVSCLQRWKSTQTTAGTWAATTGEVQLFPFPYKKPTTQIFTSAGANTYTKPWDALWANITAVAGGGAGGGAQTTTGAQFSAGAGGGAGGASIKLLDASAIGPTETATVGAAGAGAAGANGGNGGTTSFGSHVSVTGGTGGAAGTAAGAGNFSGGAGGAGSGGDINTTGQGGSTSTFSTTSSTLISGQGGSSILGGGGEGQSTTTAAGVAGTKGGGGGGGVNNVSQTQTAGGNGGIGLIIVEEYYA